MKNIKIGILDQSIIRYGSNAREALLETAETVKLAEDLGYNRFWVSEHHNSPAIAGSAPEILMVKLADATKHIKIGSGGIMLPNHSAFKMAENFRMLETLFPGRIEMGMGRAPGGDRISAMLLNPSNTFKEEDYLKQIDHLQHFFRDTAATENGRIYAIPQAESVPNQWVLSSSGGSAKIAAEKGLGLAVAKFINGNVPPEVVKIYRDNFKPSESLKEPKVLLSSFVMCGENEQMATNMRKYMDYTLVQFEKGNFGKRPSFKEVEAYKFDTYEEQRIEANSNRIISGTPDKVKWELEKIATDYDVDQLVITTMSYDKQLRLKSFKLIAEVMNLQPQLV
ncbi:luciferase family oxidoreductase, group 1 [Mesonia phycicola]|uniref:Luciferase family oxidoreductase, group 1 n=1 Tax=Mesonia phycicola TaxID=579105 RepID=A0A1M6CQR3_9FLAO|nr:LLM class flavin-dependent oxidoreductase [Mesonia phycicola]SHI63191.1 luciferase family oxidoreductase, group 1 [Mesonia phycicola]